MDAVGGLYTAGCYSDRICEPEETFARVAPLQGPHGITRLARITGLDRIGIPVWNAIRPNARSIAVHQGKGIRDADAKVSATMEALERATAENPSVAICNASMSELTKAGRRFDPLDSLIVEGQMPLAADDQTEWVEGLDLVDGNSVYLPRDAAILDRTRPCRFWQSSDGLASGNIETEAIFHGVLERIERDAEALWKLEPAETRATTKVAPRSFADPVLDSLLDQVETAGFKIHLFDIRSDIGIPAFSALLAPMRTSALRYIDVTNGSGAHPIAVRAAIRALTEAVQSRLTLISGARDDVAPSIYARELPPSLRQDLLSPASTWQESVIPHQNASLEEKLAEVTNLVRSAKAGPLYAVRLNPEEARMAVVKVFALGLWRTLKVAGACLWEAAP